ncbi:MAG: hypothetical protein ACLRMX_01500 [Lachnospira eligens]
MFTGHIKFNQMLIIKQQSFFCISEHEDFCSIGRRMFKVPIIAYDKTAIADTMGYKGMIIGNVSPLYLAGYRQGCQG